MTSKFPRENPDPQLVGTKFDLARIGKRGGPNDLALVCDPEELRAAPSICDNRAIRGHRGRARFRASWSLPGGQTEWHSSALGVLSDTIRSHPIRCDCSHRFSTAAGQAIQLRIRDCTRQMTL